MTFIRISFAVVVLFVSVVAAGAQTAAIVVRATDSDRGVVVGAPVVLILPSGEQRTGITRNDGTFAFEGLASGEYRLEIAAPGFSLFSQTVALSGDSRTVDAALTIAPFQEDVTVQAVATVPTIGRINSPLRDQPLTVSTLTADYLQSRAINDLVTALQHVASVAAYNQYGVYQYFSFRGFSDNVQMVDGIRNEGNRVSTQLANVDRLEVLKGPASVLYGGDAIGAAVNLVLKKPQAEPTYDFSATAGRWDTYRGSLGAGGRVRNSNRLFYRLDIGGESATNFRHDPSKRFNVTPSIMWRVSNTGQLDVRHMYDRNRVSGDSGIPLVPLVAGFTPDPERSAIGDPISRAVQGDGSDFIPKVPRDFRYNTPQDYGLGTDNNLRISYSQTFGQALAFRNTVGYRHFEDEYWLAEFLDVTPPSRVNRGFLYFKHHRRPWMNQAEFTGQRRLGLDHNFLAGWDYQDYPGFTDRRAAANFNTTPMDLYDPVETHVERNLGDSPVTRIDYSTQRTNGFFFQDTVTLLPQLKLVVGGRYDILRRNNHNNPVTNGVETEGPLTKGESEKFTYRAGVVYQPSTMVDLYVQNSTAFRPNFNIQADGTLLEPEEGELFEFGQRLRMVGNRLELASAVFHVVKRNVARSIGGGMFDQIGKIRSRGFETELHGRVTSALGIDLGYGFTKATFLDYFTNAGANLSGKIPRRAPEHTVTVSTSYSWANGLTLTAGTRIVSDQFINDTNTVGFNGYNIIDAGASYRRGPVQYGINLTNLTDREYFASSLGNRQLYPGQPFNVLATVRFLMN
jgi:iron complex outermembrane recepter protein